MLAAFEGVDAILHAGDATALAELAPLQQIAPVYLVMGNNDAPELATRFGWRRALRWRGWRIGLVHGDVGSRRTTALNALEAFREPPPRWEDIGGRPTPVALPVLPEAAVPGGRPSVLRVATPITTPDAADAPHLVARRGAASEMTRPPHGGSVDCIVFGHSHQPYCAHHDGVLLLNPGSPTERRREPRASFAVIESDAEGLEVRFFYL